MTRIFVFALLIVTAIPLCRADNGYEVFRDTQGREIEARIVDYDPATNRITVQLRNGRKSTVDLSGFSEADQSRVKNWYLTEEVLSPRNLVVKMAKKSIRSDRYHEKRNGWQSHYPGMEFEDVAFEVSLNNRGHNPLESITVDYCIFAESHRKEKSGESELQSFPSGSQGWVSTYQSASETSVVSLKKRDQFAISSLAGSKTSTTLTECMQLREGTESAYGTSQGNTRSYKTREVEDELSGIIVRISISLPSGGVATKEYSYPSDFLTQVSVDWSEPIDQQLEDALAAGSSMTSEEDDSSILKETSRLIWDGRFKEAEVLCRQLYEGGGDLKYHGAWRLGTIYLSHDNPDRQIDLGVEWMLKASEGGFAGPYTDLAEFYTSDPDPSVRDGKKAVKYARLMMDCWDDSPAPGACKTMACALARNGQFPQAVTMMNKAIAGMEARKGGKLDADDEYLQLLERFRRNQAWPD